MKFTKNELIYLHELLGYLDYHLAEHIFANSSKKDSIDIHAIGQKIFDKVDRELNEEQPTQCRLFNVCIKFLKKALTFGVI